MNDPVYQYPPLEPIEMRIPETVVLFCILTDDKATTRSWFRMLSGVKRKLSTRQPCLAAKMKLVAVKVMLESHIPPVCRRCACKIAQVSCFRLPTYRSIIVLSFKCTWAVVAQNVER